MSKQKIYLSGQGGDSITMIYPTIITINKYLPFIYYLLDIKDTKGSDMVPRFKNSII